MAVNTYKHPDQRESRDFFGWLNRLLHLDTSLEQVIHVKFLPQILFIVFLSILFIANRHYAERKVRRIDQLEVVVEDLRADYTTLKASYMFASKRSEVAVRARRLGLSEQGSSPILISRK